MSNRTYLNYPKELRDADDIKSIIVNSSYLEGLKKTILSTIETYRLKEQGRLILLTLSSYFDFSQFNHSEITTNSEKDNIVLNIKTKDSNYLRIFIYITSELDDIGGVYINGQFTGLNIKDYETDFNGWIDKLLSQIDPKYLKSGCKKLY